MDRKQLLQAQVERGRRAEEILNNPLIQEAFIKLKGDMLNEFNSTDLHSNKLRENAWRKSQVLNEFEQNFISIVKYGKNAKISLEQSEKPISNVI